jgi:hypothetical protein
MNNDQNAKLVIYITAQHNPYYRTDAGRWAANVKKAREFSTPEEAQQEADRIGLVTFLGEQCEPIVGEVRTFSRRRQR